MLTNNKLAFDISNIELYYNFSLYEYLKIHAKDCHIEDKSTYTSILQMVTNELYEIYEKMNVSDVISFTQCTENTFKLIWPEGLAKFNKMYNDWCKAVHSINF